MISYCTAIFMATLFYFSGFGHRKYCINRWRHGTTCSIEICKLYCFTKSKPCQYKGIIHYATTLLLSYKIKVMLLYSTTIFSKKLEWFQLKFWLSMLKQHGQQRHLQIMKHTKKVVSAMLFEIISMLPCQPSQNSQEGHRRPYIVT